jgi:hypothetical protein
MTTRSDKTNYAQALDAMLADRLRSHPASAQKWSVAAELESHLRRRWNTSATDVEPTADAAE